MQISEVGLNLIKSFEGCKLSPYLDSAKIPTIGWGTVYYEDGSRVSMDDNAISQERADQLLLFEVNSKTRTLNVLIKVPVNQNQFDAICCWTYNVGQGAAASSTLLRLLNANADINTVAAEFLKWDKAGGVVVPGLLRRRTAEQQLFLTPA